MKKLILSVSLISFYLIAQSTSNMTTIRRFGEGKQLEVMKFEDGNATCYVVHNSFDNIYTNPAISCIPIK